MELNAWKRTHKISQKFLYFILQIVLFSILAVKNDLINFSIFFDWIPILWIFPTIEFKLQTGKKKPQFEALKFFGFFCEHFVCYSKWNNPTIMINYNIMEFWHYDYYCYIYYGNIQFLHQSIIISINPAFYILWYIDCFSKMANTENVNMCCQC